MTAWSWQFLWLKVIVNSCGSPTAVKKVNMAEFVMKLGSPLKSMLIIPV